MEVKKVTKDNQNVRNRRPKPAGTASQVSLYGKVPPQARELEEAVLGAIMLENRAFDVAKQVLKAECFYIDAHQRIYKAFEYLAQKFQPIDILTVVEELKRREELDMVGGAYFVTRLTNSVVSTANLEAHSRIVMQKYIQRELIRIGLETVNEAYEDTADIFDMLDAALINFNALQTGITRSKTEQWADVAFRTWQQMENSRHIENPYLGALCGIKAIDRVTLGFAAPDLIIVAAGPGEGKSTFMLQSAKNMAATGTPAAIFSLEMRNQQLMWKIFSAELNTDVKSVRKGNLSEQQWAQLKNKLNGAFGTLPIHMTDIGGLSIYELMSTCRVLKAKYNIGVILIDYIQLISTTGGEKRFGTRESEVNYISKQLKALAMELNVPIIALSQLSRLEKGAKRLYKLNDLRESGALEADADGVIFIYRPHYHGVERFNKKDPEFEEDDVLFIIAKWRLGDTGRISAKFDGRSSRFLDREVQSLLPEGNWKPVPVDYTQSNRQEFDPTQLSDDAIEL